MELKTGASVSGGGGVKGGWKAIGSLKIFAPAIIFTVVMFGTLGWYAWHSYRHLMVVETQHFRTTKLIGVITHLDEVLTMSARMGAATGDSQWQRRYEEYEPQLETAIKDVTRLAPEALMSEAAARTDAANVRLVEMERDAFGLVREGDRQAATTMLNSAEYAEQKRIYREGMNDFTEGLQRHTHAELRRHRRQVLIAASFVAVSVSLVLFVWVGMLGKLKYGSERRSVRKALRRSEAQFKNFFENTAVGLYRTSPDGRILMANPALVRMLGYSSFEELTERSLEKEGYEPQYSRSEFKERIEKEGRVVGLESAWAKRDGTTLFIIENSRAIRDEDGNTLYYEGTAEDITERKKAEDTLKESEEKYRTLIANIPDVAWTTDFEGNTTFVSPNVEQIYGYKPEEICGRGDTLWLGRIHPDDLERVRKAFTALFEQNVEFDIEYRIRRKDGEWIWLRDRSISTYEKDGVRYADGIFSDITKYRKTREALKESEANLAMAQRVGHIGSWRRDIRTGKAIWSDEVYRLLGLEPNEVESGFEVFLSYVHPEDRELVKRVSHRAELEGKTGRADFRIIRADGVECKIETRVEAIETESGKPVRTVGTLQEITERKNAEEEMKKFKTIAEKAGHGVGMIKLEGNLIYVNESFAKMHGYGVDELMGKDLSIFHTKEQMARVNRLNERLVREGSFVGEEVWHKKKDNTRFLTLMNGTLITDEKKRPLFMAATAIDVTKTKQAEAALRQSEQKYRILVENLPQRVFLKDQNSIYVSCNENFARDVDMSPELLPGKSDYDLFPVEIAEKYRADDKTVMESGEIKGIDEAYTRGGREMNVHTVKTPVRDEEGNVTGVLGIFWDITEQKRVERALSESEEKYRTLVESAGETIITMDRDGVYLFVNKTGAERFGGKPEDYIGKTIWDAFPKEIADRQMGIVRGVIDTGKGENHIAPTQLQGQMRWYNITVEPLRDSSGKVTAALILARDIHELRQAEMELEAYREKMARAERLASLGTVSAMLAHELTQPLTVIGLSIEDSLAELEGITCPPSVQEGLRDSLSEVSNAASIVERFRGFARKSSGKTVERVELGAVAARVVKLLGKGAEEAGLSLRLKGVDDLPAVYLSEKEVEQLLFALVQNAIHAAGGQKDRELIIDGAVKDEYIELRFSDNCGGIEPGDVDKLFDPFFTTKPAGEGTGLGLCIVERIAERSGGRVSVENWPGEGLTFVVTLGISGEEMS